MNKKENRRRLIFSVIVVGLLIWVGSKVKDHLEFQQEMVRIVHSQEVKKLIVDDLKQEDPDAFTENGKIQSYEIDDETIEHNPMGGIMFKVIINGDKEITGSMGLRKRSEDGPIRSVGMSTSVFHLV
ncbi:MULTISPECIES: DUF1310 family protein [unclassified Streptococcus]|uniref:DUF1310 family protein n=1 Tax=unclassified Streptococcus TaxID=2608887 RepID=UPI00263CC928|nr:MULTISPECIES: DUF1310 family protein [unclassified Streptococcus]MDN5021990.1 DUF1310 family protein [Streptococcus sp. SP1]MDN5028735.1 DUF1310 family protein [Streptococcus sp. SP4]